MDPLASEAVDNLVAALRASESRFRAVFENVEALSIQGYARDGTVTYWNPASTTLYGYLAEEALGKNLYELIIPAEAQDLVRRDVQWMFDNRKALPAARLALKNKQGETVHVYSSHAVVATADGEMTMFCVDVDLRPLAHMESALKDAEQRYRALFDCSPSGILLFHHGYIVDCNAAVCTMLGAKSGQLLGQTPAILAPPSSVTSTTSLITEMLLKDIQAGQHLAIECDLHTFDGRCFSAEIFLDSIQIAGHSHAIATIRDISKRKAAERQIAFLANHDTLTGLPNRVLLRDRFDHAKAVSDRNRSWTALLFLDLDHFKIINDTLGHQFGDELLQRVVERLHQCVRDSDTVSRLGGDEFVLLLDDIKNLSGIERTAAAVHQALASAFTLQERDISIGTSIGIAIYPQDGENFDELLQHADTAMYAAKDSGRNKSRFYNSAMQIAIDKRAQLDAELRRALPRRELQLHYQAQVDVTGKVLGAEALLRWLPPEGQPIGPLEFIGLAEETGFIIPLGRFVLEEACKRLAIWAQHAELQSLTLAVNISGRQFRERDFETMVADVLRQTGANPNRLKLELTESVVLDNVEEVISRMLRLQQLGLVFSLDDFGTGYSSLSYLKRLPLEQLKIDRGFVQNLDVDPHDKAIVVAILAMSQSMGLNVIAEGIETANQRAVLTAYGCRAFQGYLFAKPMPAEQFESLLRSGHTLPAPTAS